MSQTDPTEYLQFFIMILNIYRKRYTIGSGGLKYTTTVSDLQTVLAKEDIKCQFLIRKIRNNKKIYAVRFHDAFNYTSNEFKPQRRDAIVVGIEQAISYIRRLKMK